VQYQRTGRYHVFIPDDGILSVVSSCTPRSGLRSATSDRFQPPASQLTHYDREDTARPSPSAKLSFNNHHHSEYNEDLHRQRVLVSAYHRRKLHPRVRRVRSTPPSMARKGTGGPSDYDKGNRSPYDAFDDEPDKFDFVVTNASATDEHEWKER